MKPDLLIFDLDGTLLDTLSSLAGAFNSALAAMHCPTHPVDDYRFIIGNGATVAAERCLPENRQSPGDIEQCLTGFRSVYDRTWREAAPYPGIMSALEELSGQVALSVLSNKDQAFTSQCVDYFFPNVFTGVTGHSETVRHKPHPEGAMKLIERAGTTPERTLIIGDTATDMETAAACGMSGIGVLWGFRDAGELTRAGATRLIESPGALATLLLL